MVVQKRFAQYNPMLALVLPIYFSSLTDSLCALQRTGAVRDECFFFVLASTQIYVSVVNED